MKRNFSKRTAALLIAAALLLVSGTVTGARAAFIAQSDLYRAQFYVNHLQVHLLENGKDVCGGANTIEGSSKVTGALATSLGYSKNGNTETLGTVDPGRAYAEVIQAENGKDVEQYVRLTIRKYWLKKDANGNTVKATELSPSLIKLTYNGGEYNKTDWVLGESSTESATYYYKKKLGPNAKSEPLFDTLTIDRAVIPDMHQPTDAELLSVDYAGWPSTQNSDGSTTYSHEVGNVTIMVTVSSDGKSKAFSYSYKYDGYTFYIEADVQALQTHNAQDAIHSAWGVYNVKVNADGSLSVQ